MTIHEDDLDPAEAQKATHRLTGMHIHEVSMVDRAANKRTFLTTKRDSTMGAKVNKEFPAGGGPDAKDDEEKPEGQGAAQKEGEQIQAAVKDSLINSLAAAAEKLISLGNAVQDMPVTEAATDPVVPSSVLAGINEAGQMLATIISQNTGDGSAAGGEVTQSASGDPSQPPQDPNDQTVKAGRRMASNNLTKFKEAMNMLRQVFSHVSQQPAPRAAAPAPATAPQAAPPPVAAAVQPALAAAAKSASGRPVTPAPAMSAEAFEVLKAATDAVDQSNALVTTLTAKASDLEKKLTDALAENSRLSKATGAGNGSVLEAGRVLKQTGTHWPLDLAPSPGAHSR